MAALGRNPAIGTPYTQERHVIRYERTTRAGTSNVVDAVSITDSPFKYSISIKLATWLVNPKEPLVINPEV